jgi:hypothetical protein
MASTPEQVKTVALPLESDTEENAYVLSDYLSSDSPKKREAVLQQSPKWKAKRTRAYTERGNGYNPDEVAYFKAEAELAKKLSMPWSQRGPPPPWLGGPQKWKGGTFRTPNATKTSGGWYKRGGGQLAARNAKYGASAKAKAAANQKANGCKAKSIANPSKTATLQSACNDSYHKGSSSSNNNSSSKGTTNDIRAGWKKQSWWTPRWDQDGTDL